jgi:putative methyltransferase (TIGR04325 family)
VKNGEAIYERDGIIYDHIKVNYYLLSVLLLLAGENKNKLTIIDFGGSLGTSYYQNIGFLSHVTDLNWCIIEQPQFVEIGRKSFENDHVKFYYTLEECLAKHPEPNLFHISGVLQYIEQPYDLLKKIQSYNIPNIILDFIGYNHKNEDRITIQHVPPIFYGIEASYACTFFNRLKLETQMEENYKKVFDFISEPEKYYLQFKPFRYEGSFWRLNSK